MTVPVLADEVSEVDEAQLTVVELPPVRRLAGANPLGDTGLEQASPMSDVELLGSRLNG
jgi:hypothetical protein